MFGSEERNTCYLSSSCCCIVPLFLPCMSFLLFPFLYSWTSLCKVLCVSRHKRQDFTCFPASWLQTVLYRPFILLVLAQQVAVGCSATEECRLDRFIPGILQGKRFMALLFNHPYGLKTCGGNSTNSWKWNLMLFGVFQNDETGICKSSEQPCFQTNLMLWIKKRCFHYFSLAAINVPKQVSFKHKLSD